MQEASLQILYEDNHLLVVVKPAGMLIQGDKTGDTTLLQIAKHWLIDTYQKPGNVFLGLVHRLDRPVAGVVVFAKTSKAASRLSHQFRERTVQKSYLAVVQGTPDESTATLTHYIKKRMGNRRVQIAEQPFNEAARAMLTYTVLEMTAEYSFLHVTIHTGRHHQIRAQLAAIGHPVIGDRKYGCLTLLPDKSLALFASQLTIRHPTQKHDLTFTASPPLQWPWTLFESSAVNRKIPSP